MLSRLTNIFRVKPEPYGVSIMADSLSPGTLTLECVQDKLEELRATLPRPIPDTPYGREVRDEIARCMFLALHPADVLDATFACQIILLNAHADDSLRIAREAVHDPKFARSARAQARSRMRLMRDTLGDLHARQLARAAAQAGRPQPAPQPPCSNRARSRHQTHPPHRTPMPRPSAPPASANWICALSKHRTRGTDMTIAEALPDLAPEIARLTLHRLISTLPRASTDTAMDCAEREAEAIAALGSLYPATAIEARLAARVGFVGQGFPCGSQLLTPAMSTPGGDTFPDDLQQERNRPANRIREPLGRSLAPMLQLTNDLAADWFLAA